MKRYPIEELGPALDRLQEELKESPFLFVVLLGSASEGREFRDLDLGFQTDGSCANILELTLRWGSRLERAAGMPVDLVPLESASVGFQHEATKGQVIFLRDEEALACWKEKTWNRFFDLQSLFRRQTRDLLAG
jgi:predicted nucleotidyltransferase